MMYGRKKSLTNSEFTWERVDKADELAKLCGCTPKKCAVEIETDEDSEHKTVKKV